MGVGGGAQTCLASEPGGVLAPLQGAPDRPPPPPGRLGALLQ